MKNPDTRVQFTRNALKKALLTLMKEKNVDKITVKELCETAGINRGTFYLHYDSPSALQKDMEDQFLNEYMELFRSYWDTKRDRNLMTLLFDRIRENRKALVKETPGGLKTLVNDSIAQTLSRTVNTSLTTVVMVISLLIFGVSSIRDFALPLMAGILVGTYSSICLASGMWYMMRVRVLKKEAAAAVEAKSSDLSRNKKAGKRKK